ncbi:MAG: HAD hydrolase family protein [Candidatus Omnitrophica bacterium]|nr:HAD hydrolase family protein [Candidatus Omnitrophota bacterium]MDD5351847.1 HAD hydrolase family protein [Candidatus Omnitrophota bacterium]MDD5550673.1 HAD hydrolase family protein [Candidatus Omnitrophota bacterium]
MTIQERARKIKLLILDVDGVLTDGRIIYDSKGRDLKLFDVHDGLGVYLLYRMGIKTILITAKGSKAIKPRARDMHVDKVYENIFPKTKIYENILSDYGVTDAEVCFVGDDLVDLCILKKVGFPVAVFNACPEVKEISSYVTQKKGGRGAVREVAEFILKSQDRWQEALKIYEG